VAVISWHDGRRGCFYLALDERAPGHAPDRLAM